MRHLKNLSLVIALAVLIAVTVVAYPVMAQDPSPQSVTGTPQTVSIFGKLGITQTTTGAGVAITNFGIGDCYTIVDVTDQQTVTVALQHSASLGGNYVAGYTLSAQSADTTVFTRTSLYGNYLRTVATLATTNPVTIAVNCVLKDNAGS